MHILSLEDFLKRESVPIHRFIGRLILNENYELFDKYIGKVIYYNVVIKGNTLKDVFKNLEYYLFNKCYIYGHTYDFIRNSRPIRIKGFFENHVHVQCFVKMRNTMRYSKTDIYNALYAHFVEKFNDYNKLYRINDEPINGYEPDGSTII